MNLFMAFEEKRRIESEIQQCDVLIGQASFSEREVLKAEKEALQAEMEYRLAQSFFEDKTVRVAVIYQCYGEMGLNKGNWEDYLYENYYDEFDFIKALDFLEPMINPERIKIDLEYLDREAKAKEERWTEALQVWEKYETSKKNIKKAMPTEANYRV